jgi:hypothetical protein
MTNSIYSKFSLYKNYHTIRNLVSIKETLIAEYHTICSLHSIGFCSDIQLNNDSKLIGKKTNQNYELYLKANVDHFLIRLTK